MKLTFKFILKTILLLSIVVFNSCNKKEKEKEKVKEIKITAYNNAVEKSLCNSSWFPHSQTPAPLEGKKSLFAAKNTTNAIFHQWSWQKFLWLTKPTTEVILLPILTRGEPTPIPLKVKIPLFLNPKNMHQVTSHMQNVVQQQGAALVLTDTAQAGSGGVLKTNPAYNDAHKSESVFYSIHVNSTMKNAAEKFKDSILTGKLGKNNLSSFPIGSLELKVSWTPVTAIPKNKIANYYTTVAAISTNGKTYTNTKVALLGMHVVGVVENHPEFIWATFEHNDLAPNYNWSKNEANSSTEKLLFSKGTTSGIEGITWVTNSAKLKSKAFDLFEYGVPRNIDGSLMITCQQEPINSDNIREINNCVKINLEKEVSAWKNYFYNGSIWIGTDGLNTQEQAQLLVNLEGAIANATEGSSARGSLNNANVTMETYTQTFKSNINDITVDNLANCFSCHNAVSYTGDKSPIYLSHIFDAYIKRAEGKTFKQVEMLKAKQEVQEFMENRLK
ncbi:hypothetical protein [Tenacibaculum aestuariivivum]|uniref:hypothetical protein n=1 Tax=Tenacibaculum aestuariivivum TaxID=2006131 RepID=UPI003AB2DFAA